MTASKIGTHFVRWISRLLEWHLYVGRDPRFLPPRSFVIFPCLPSVCACGLAGVIAVTRSVPADRSITERLAARMTDVRNASVARVFRGDIPIDGYCAGDAVQTEMEGLVDGLKNESSLLLVLSDESSLAELSRIAQETGRFVTQEETVLEESGDRLSSQDSESVNHAFERIKDAVWTLNEDILRSIKDVAYLAGATTETNLSPESFRRFRKITFLLNALDRLEVRGRDSAGIQIAVTFNDNETWERCLSRLRAEHLSKELTARARPGDLLDGAIHLARSDNRTRPSVVTFTYKKAAVTGELGENGRYLRRRIRGDRVLHTVLAETDGMDISMGHTRWASVGSITEENCHPVNSDTVEKGNEAAERELPGIMDFPHYGTGPWTISVALNGDIDNYDVLREMTETSQGSRIDHRVTTDTKIIPLRIESYLKEGWDLKEAFRLALNEFEGSHAIAMQSTCEPGRIYLALRGSGQALYVGLADDEYVFASEIYGIVERTSRFITMDGERERVPGNASTRGQIFILDGRGSDLLSGIEVLYYDGHPLTLGEGDIQHAEMTTRDIDMKDYPHFLLKEIVESPRSVNKTLRGKYRVVPSDKDDRCEFNIGDDIVPSDIRHALAEGRIRRIFLVGQGTAAVAGAAIAEIFDRCTVGAPVTVHAKKATDVSGYFLTDSMADTLIIAVTQSGTTTDTNRAVAMARERGAYLIAIVNRRQSDITQKVHGVFYTSDGRDIEMSVASTKAFYSQVVAGHMLALYCGRLLGVMSDAAILDDIRSLERLPEVMNSVIRNRERIRTAAWEPAKTKKYWAVVGSGPNKIASDEIRIKLSELCYKTISTDVTEDKKHIDLSSEPLILMCAAGNPPPVTEDIVKDAEIFAAHNSTVIAITEEGEHRFDGCAVHVISVPPVPFPLSIVVNTLAGHLWGYYAALSIDEEAQIIRRFRSTLATQTTTLDEKGYSLFESIANPDLHRDIKAFAREFTSRRRQGYYGSLDVDTAADCVLLLKYAAGKLSLEDYWEEYGGQGFLPSPLDMLDITLGKAIDELARPIDAIRHQAKTVTVGTSRKEMVLTGPIFKLLRDLFFSLENLTTRDGLGISRIQRVITAVTGYTLYRVERLNDEGRPAEGSTLVIAKRRGISTTMTSRFEVPAPLAGTKRTIIESGDLYAGSGHSDGMPIVMIPLRGEMPQTAYILLVHVTFDEFPGVTTVKTVLAEKWNALTDIINEYNIDWKDEYISDIPVNELLGESADRIALRIIEGIS